MTDSSTILGPILSHAPELLPPIVDLWGNAEITVLDDSYEQIETVTTGGEVGPERTDFHDTTNTDRSTMLLISYYPTPKDLSAVGVRRTAGCSTAAPRRSTSPPGPSSLSGRRPITSRPSTPSRRSPRTTTAMGTQNAPFDWFHLNSVTEDGDGNLILSARNTHAIYKLDKQTGELIWTLGSKDSDFEMGEVADFAWQHDAHRSDDGTMTLLDN